MSHSDLSIFAQLSSLVESLAALGDSERRRVQLVVTYMSIDWVYSDHAETPNPASGEARIEVQKPALGGPHFLEGQDSHRTHPYYLESLMSAFPISL